MCQTIQCLSHIHVSHDSISDTFMCHTIQYLTHIYVSDDTMSLTVSQTDTFFRTPRNPSSHCVVSRRSIAWPLRLTHSIICLTHSRDRASQTDTFYRLSDAFYLTHSIACSIVSRYNVSHDTMSLTHSCVRWYNVSHTFTCQTIQYLSHIHVSHISHTFMCQTIQYLTHSCVRDILWNILATWQTSRECLRQQNVSHDTMSLAHECVRQDSFARDRVRARNTQDEMSRHVYRLTHPICTCVSLRHILSSDAFYRLFYRASLADWHIPSANVSVCDIFYRVSLRMCESILSDSHTHTF